MRTESPKKLVLSPVLSHSNFDRVLAMDPSFISAFLTPIRDFRRFLRCRPNRSIFLKYYPRILIFQRHSIVADSSYRIKYVSGVKLSLFKCFAAEGTSKYCLLVAPQAFVIYCILRSFVLKMKGTATLYRGLYGPTMRILWLNPPTMRILWLNPLTS